MKLNVASVPVPLGFVGLHLHRYPVNPQPADTSPENYFGLPEPEPSFAFGGYRSLNGCPFWRDVATASGVYKWDTTDAFIDAQAALGRTIIYTVYGTPRWAAPSALQDYLDPYEVQAGGAPPTNNADAADFIAELLNRYNTSGTRKIHYIELWNEPDFLENPGSQSTWWGTALQLLQMNVAIVTAAKAVDAGIKILSPGFRHTDRSLAEWLSAYDAASNLTGANLVDGIAIHPYTSYYYGATSFYNGRSSTCSVVQAQAAVLAAGCAFTLPIFITEYGIAGDPMDSTVSEFLATSAQYRKTFVARMLAVAAARGIQFFGIYSYNSRLFGDLMSDTSGVIAGVSEIQAALPGNTIAAGGAVIDQLGVVRIRLSNGELYSW
jgi:hypothetical protein